MRELWPPARVRLRTPRLELRLPDEDELARLAAAAAEGVHEPGARPFGVPWGAQPAHKRMPRCERKCFPIRVHEAFSPA